MKITTGVNDFEVINTGTVISYKDETVNFELDQNLKYKMRFIVDEDDKSNRLDFKIVDGSHMEILLTNFNNSLGTGNVEPLRLGKLNNRNVYLNFVVFSFGKTDTKIIHHTWYHREEANDE